jgi:hypothetical protein
MNPWGSRQINGMPEPYAMIEPDRETENPLGSNAETFQIPRACSLYAMLPPWQIVNIERPSSEIAIPDRGIILSAQSNVRFDPVTLPASSKMSNSPALVEAAILEPSADSADAEIFGTWLVQRGTPSLVRSCTCPAVATAKNEPSPESAPELPLYLARPFPRPSRRYTLDEVVARIVCPSLATERSQTSSPVCVLQIGFHVKVPEVFDDPGGVIVISTEPVPSKEEEGWSDEDEVFMPGESAEVVGS